MLKMQVIGYLGRDVQVNTREGGSVGNFSVADTQKFNNTEKTVWVDCSLWDRDKIYPYLKKGSLVFCEGYPTAHQYTNREGKIVSSLRLAVTNIQLLGGRRDDQSAAATSTGAPSHTPAPAADQPENWNNETYDDLPF